MSGTFFEIYEKNGNPYYLIPAGTIIYRGIKKTKKYDEYYSHIYKQHKNTFFAFYIDAALLYGNSVFEFEFTQEVSLLALDKIGANFFDKCHEKVQQILIENYVYTDGSLYDSMRIRNSVNKKDTELVDYLCRQGEMGYATDFMHKENEYYQKMTAHTKVFQQELFDEMKSRIKEDDESVPYCYNGYYYITRYEKGKDYPIYSRKKETLSWNLSRHAAYL
jgi:hypothetical protein